jgi:dipeptidyl aminopeptidase/acylaminoacyl peptidase
MPSIIHCRSRRLLLLALVAGLVLAVGCSPAEPERPAAPPAVPQRPTPAADLPPATPGLELQEEDYAKARAAFRTRLIRKGPAPQQWGKVRLPPGVIEVEYRSGDLRLKAWTSRPLGTGGKKLPAVLYLHGGWAFDVDDWEQPQPFRDAGFVVLVPLLRGENGLPGHFSMFYDEIDDVLAAANYLAKLAHVDPQRIYVAGHSAGGTHAMLAAMASDRFRAAASLSGSPDRVDFARGWQQAIPFDQSDIREFRLRSPVAYATSFKCPARLYVGSGEPVYHASTRRTALLAKAGGLDVEAVVVPGDHFGCVPEALRRAIAFFRSH